MPTERRQPILSLCRVSFGIAVVAAVCAITPSRAQTPCTGAAGPWATCPQWTGPELSQFATGVPNDYAYDPLDSFSLSGGGLAGFAQLSGITPYIATSTGAAFSSSSLSNIGTDCYAGNFDGSGRTSVACPTAGNVAYATSSGSGLNSFVNIPISPNTNIYSARSLFSTQGAEVFYPVNPCLVMDVDGDGTDDLVCGGGGGPNASQGDHQLPYPTHTLDSTVWGVYLSTGTSFNYVTWQGPAGVYSYGFACSAGNFDGDGLQDLLCHYTSGASWVVLHSTGLQSSGNGWTAETWANGPSINVIGDGPHSCSLLSDNTTQVCPMPCLSGDFNGDGLTDVSCDNGNNIWDMGFSGTSGGFQSTQNWNAPSVNPGYEGFPGPFCAVKDVYSVGLSGLLCNLSNGSTNWWYVASTKTGVTTTYFSTSFPVGSVANTPTADFTLQNSCVVADVNGDGIIDVACQEPSNTNPSGGGGWNVGLSTRPN
jgi:hypothetical protein